MIETDEFSARTIPSTKIAIEVESFSVGSTEETSEVIKFQYDQDLRCTSQFVENNNCERWNGSDDVVVSGAPFCKPTELLTLRTIYNQNSSIQITLCPKTEPMKIHLSSKPAETVEAIIVNGPDLFRTGAEVSLASESFDFLIRDFSDTFDVRKEARLNSNLRGMKITTGILTLKNRNHTEISPSQIFDSINELRWFFSFVRGAFSGFGHVIGKDQQQKCSFAYLGFNSADSFFAPKNWYGFGVTKDLPQIFSAFSEAFSQDKLKDPLQRAIKFYCASNIARSNDVELAVIASQAALESLVYEVLQNQAGWSQDLLGKKNSFSDKLRAAAAFAGLPTDILSDLPLLKKRANSRQSDGYELVPFYRNMMIHPKKTARLDNFEPHQSWLLSQWLCEMFIFFLIDYKGDYYDRRLHSGFAPGPEKIPLA